MTETNLTTNTQLTYLQEILKKYEAEDLRQHATQINELHRILKNWAGDCLIDIYESGSRAKGTAINLGSDVDYMVALKSTCEDNADGLEKIYNSLYQELQRHYSVRKQNVSFRIILNNSLEVDIMPARKHSGNTNDYSIRVSKQDTWKQTNIQQHIKEISESGRTNEIKLLKIWREKNKLEFPSIYLEYLLKNIILKSKPLDNLVNNFIYMLQELAKDSDNPLFQRLVDPAKPNNILSDLLNDAEKNMIIKKAKEAIQKKYWTDILN